MKTAHENKNKPGVTVNIVLSFILILFILFLIEGVLSVVLYQKHGPEKLASIEIIRTLKNNFTRHEFPVNVEPHMLVRPDSSKEVNTKIADEAMKSNRFVQDAWVEFRNMDFNGSYMHMTGSTRCT